MKKALTALLLTLLLACSTAAITVNPEGETNMTFSPEEVNSTTYTVDFDSNTSNVQITSSNTGDFDVSFSTTYIESGQEVDVQLIAPDNADYSQNITIQFEEERDAGNTTETQNFQKYIVANTRNPYNTLFEGWVNSTQTLEINGGSYDVSNIQSSLFLNNNSVQIEQGNSQTINDVRVTVTETIPGEYANVLAESQKDSATFDISTQANIQSNEECKLFISTQGGTTIERDSVFFFNTVKEEDGSAVGNTYVRLMRVSDGSLVGKTTTDQYGYGQIQIPEDLGSDNPDDTPQLVLRVQKQDSPCDPSRKSVSLNTPYGEYIEEKEKFHLQVDINDEGVKKNSSPIQLVNGNLSGTVTSKTGDTVSTGVMVVERPDGSTTDFSFQEAEFSYKPDSTDSTYKIRATKSNYRDSPWTEFEYVDECPDQDGTIEANGCLNKEMFVRFYQQTDQGEEQVPANELQPDTAYTVKVMNEQNELATEFDSSMTVSTSEGEDSIDFQNGKARYSFPSEYSEYEISYSGEGAFGEYSKGVEFDNTGMLPNINVFQILGVGLGLVTVLFIGMWWWPPNTSSSSSSGGSREVKVNDKDIGGSSSHGVTSKDLSADIGMEEGGE